MKIGFIGAGNMASAIAAGIVQKGIFAPDDVLMTDIDYHKVADFTKKYGMQAVKTNTKIVEEADIVLLAVKPNVVEKILQELESQLVQRQTLLISIAAGTTLESLSRYLHQQELPIVRVMPNVNAMISAGVAAICGNSYASHAQIQTVLEMFQGVGTAYELPEKDFSNFTALAGSAPAYAYLFIDAMSRAGVKHGLPKNLATEIAAQTVLGSAKMVLESEDTPWDLIDKVCSPGGTTIAGLIALEDAGFMSDVIKGIDATIAKDQEMMEK